MVGDSVCTGVYVSSVLSTFWRARSCSGITGFSTPTRRPRAFGAFRRDWRSLRRLLRWNMRASARSSITRTRGKIFSGGFCGRVILRTNWPIAGDGAISRSRSDRDRTQQCRLGRGDVHPANWSSRRIRLQRQSRRFRENFARQMRRLIESARMQGHRVAAWSTVWSISRRTSKARNRRGSASTGPGPIPAS